MPRKFATSKESYAAFYSRVEAAFKIEDMTREALADWLRNDSMVDSFALTREIAIQINNATTLGELRELRKEARLLTIHRITLLKRINRKVEEIRVEEREQIIARGIATVEEFAKVRRINLGDKRIGRIETWKNKKALTIRDEKGRFKSWKFL